MGASHGSSRARDPRAAATTPTSLVASASPALLLLDEIVVFVEDDEGGSEFKFCNTMPDTFGHSGVIGKIETVIGDRSRIDCDLAGDGFMHAPLTASSCAYLPLPPGLEGIEYLEYPQPVVGMRSHEPIAIAGSPDLSTNENGLFEQATRSWTNGINFEKRHQSPLFSSTRHFISATFLPPPPCRQGGEGVPGSTPGNSHTADPMRPGNSHTADPVRPIAFVASSEDVAIGVGTMASGHYFGDRGAFDVESLLVIPARPSAGRRHQDGFCLFLCYLIVSTSLGGPLGPRARALLARCLVLVL